MVGIPESNNFFDHLCVEEVITLRRQSCRFFLPGMAMFVLTLLVSSISAEETLFPTPLHLTRRITDPFSEQPVMVEEFCQGSRIVSVIGEVTSIADYSAGTLTRIDRHARTFSVTSFGELSRSRAAGKWSRPVGSPQSWNVSLSAMGEVDGRSVERVVIERKVDGGQQELEVAVNPLVPVSRAAAEALLGFSFPAAPRTAEAELLFGALAKRAGESRSGRQVIGIPMAQIERFSFQGEELESRSELIRVGTEVIDPRLLEVPAGSVRVENEGIDVWRMLKEIDHPTRP